MIKTIIFDFDGTLADTQQTIIETAQATLEALNLPPISPGTLRPLIGLPLRETFVRLVGQPAKEQLFDECVAAYHRLFEEKAELSIRLFPNVKETLEQLHKQHITLTIASSRGHQSLSSLAHRLELAPLLSLILGEDDVINKKPAPDMVLETLRLTATSAEEALVVGDTTYDLAMGQGAGCRTVGVTYGNHSRQQLETQHPRFIIDDFSQLRRIVMEENRGF